MKKTYTLCDHGGCPLKETCARYLPGLDRKTVVHFDPHPYSDRRGTCLFYEKDDHIFQELNIVSSGD